MQYCNFMFIDRYAVKCYLNTHEQTAKRTCRYIECVNETGEQGWK